VIWISVFITAAAVALAFFFIISIFVWYIGYGVEDPTYNPWKHLSQQQQQQQPQQL
jgi:hypothetical protein